jgi:hypothetical protein
VIQWNVSTVTRAGRSLRYDQCVRKDIARLGISPALLGVAQATCTGYSLTAQAVSCDNQSTSYIRHGESVTGSSSGCLCVKPCARGRPELIRVDKTPFPNPQSSWGR